MPRTFRYVVSFVLAAIALPLRAEAYCRGLTELPPPGYEPTSSGCFVGTDAAKQLYWTNACVSYSLTSTASAKATLEQATALAADAFAAWTETACDGGRVSIDVVDRGPVECGLVEYNANGPNQNLIVFRDDGWPHPNASGTLALTTITFDTNSGEIYDADMEVNSASVPLVVEGPVPAGSFDLKSILTHEAGHFLGLGHSEDRSAIMYAHYHADAMLVADDVSGICSIYPADGTRNTSAGPVAAGACDATPRHDFSTECGSQNPNPEMPPETTGSTRGGCSMAPARRDGALGAAWMLLGLVAQRRRSSAMARRSR